MAVFERCKRLVGTGFQQTRGVPHFGGAGEQFTRISRCISVHRRIEKTKSGFELGQWIAQGRSVGLLAQFFAGLVGGGVGLGVGEATRVQVA